MSDRVCLPTGSLVSYCKTNNKVYGDYLTAIGNCPRQNYEQLPIDAEGIEKNNVCNTNGATVYVGCGKVYVDRTKAALNCPTRKDVMWIRDGLPYYYPSNQNSTPTYDLRIGAYMNVNNASYDSMKQICESKGKKLCNRNDLCDGRNPKDGLNVFATDNWIAVGDSPNEWITFNAQGDRRCKTHTEVAGTTPQWGLVSNPQGFERAVKCCDNISSPTPAPTTTVLQRCMDTIRPGGHQPGITWGDVPQSERDFWHANSNQCNREICKNFKQKGFVPNQTFGSMNANDIQLAQALNCNAWV